MNRITAGGTNSGCGANCWGLTFGYDQWANLTTATATGSATALNLTINGNNQITTGGFTYDASGNLTADVTSSYAWNAESEIKTANGVNYTYDGDGNRVQKSNGKIYWYGAGTEILDESDASGNITDEYVFFGGKRAAHRTVSSGSITYYAEDFLGSTRVMTTSAGEGGGETREGVAADDAVARVRSCKTMGASANNVERMNGLSEEAVREIEQIHARWIECEVAGEDRSLMAMCADDIELWPPDAQPVVGRAAVEAWMVRGTTRIHSIEITERRIRGSNEIAYLTANYKTTFSLREDSTARQSRGSHLWILRKRAGKWVVSLVSWSLW